MVAVFQKLLRSVSTVQPKQNLQPIDHSIFVGVKMAPRETENNAYAKFWGDKQRALWYVILFSGLVNN